MTGLLQRMGHRETALGFLLWSVFAVLVIHVSAFLLNAGIVRARIPVYATLATLMLAVIMGRNVAGRGVGPAFAWVALNTVPVAIAGAVVTVLVPQLGWHLLAAPVCLAAGAAIGILQQRRAPAYQNPGSAAAGAATAFAIFAMGSWFALGAMDARLGQGVVEVNSYLAEYDCLDPQHARLAEAIHSLGSANNRQRIENALRLGERPCTP